MELRGATALITGATGGIGRSLVQAFAAQGCKLILSSRSREALEELAGRHGGRAIVADLAQPGEPERLVEQARDADLVVANAALPASGPLESFSLEELDRALAVNLRAPVVMARLFAPLLAARGQGHLLFVGSLSGRAATPYSSLYNATKFGLRGFALALRAELAERGVGVSVVEPGFVREAGMFAKSGAKLPPLIGTVSPDQVARAAVDAVKANRGEVTVAPPLLKAATAFAALAPGIAERVVGLTGGAGIARSVAAGQREMR